MRYVCHRRGHSARWTGVSGRFVEAAGRQVQLAVRAIPGRIGNESARRRQNTQAHHGPRARGQTVDWFMWGGFPSTNAYVNGYVVPRVKELLAQMNADRVEAGEAPWPDVNEMAEAILKNRLKLLIKEAEGVVKDTTRNRLKDATPEQIEQIKTILGE